MSFRYRLYPEADQQPMMVEHCHHARLVWNLALGQMNTAYRRGSRCDWSKWDAELAELRNAPGFEWLKAGSSSCQQQALRQLRRAWVNYFKNPDHFGRPKFRSRVRTTLGFVVRDVDVRILNRKWASLAVPKVGRVKFRLDKRKLEGYGMAHVTCDRQGRWHVSFAAPQPAVKNTDGWENRQVGVDRGITDTIACSDRTVSSIPKPSPKGVETKRALQRKLARQEKGSNRYNRNRQAIAKLDGREADGRKDWIEKTSTRLVSENAVNAFEALRVKDMAKSASGTLEKPGKNVAQKRGLNRSIRRSCWGALARRTEQKAAATPGRTYVEVNPAFTSQRCSECGHTEKANRQGKLFHCQKCGHTDDADFQASDNILADGLAVIRRDNDSESGCPKGTLPDEERQLHTAPHTA